MIPSHPPSCYPVLSRIAAQLVHWKGKDKVVHVPAVVAVLSPFAPSDKLGIKSVQMETEMIVPMREMKMDWIPYIPDTTGRGSDLRRHRSNIFTLKCIQRRAGLRQMKQERVKKFEYCLPCTCHAVCCMMCVA
ncbi:unnamed protein product [Closterium sp. NIES-53]